MGYRTNIARYVAKWGIAQLCLCKTKCQGGVSHLFGGVLTSPKIRKIPAPIKIKSALPPPPPRKIQNTPPPPKTRNFMDIGFPAERTHFFQVSITLGQPFPAPELRTRIFYGHEDFSDKKYRAIWGIAVIVSQYRARYGATKPITAHNQTRGPWNSGHTIYKIRNHP